MPQHQTTDHVPQPVKKRSRFSNVTTLTEEDLPTQQRNVPAGFVRDLLDEENSEDDPDFDGDVELSDEDDEALEDLLESDVVLENQNAVETPHLSPASGVQRQENVPFLTLDDLPDEDLEFEVDSLDSTDDEDDNDGLQEDIPLESTQSGPSSRAGPATEYISFGDIQLNSDDEEDDPDFEANIEPREVLPSRDTYDDDDNEPGQSEARDDDYIQFLMSLLANNGEERQEEGQNAEADNGPSNTSHPVSEIPVNLAGDDDDDFDYLRASAMIQDDPLEYRDDLHVSRREVAQLLFNNHESTLRRQTRTLRAKKAPAQQIRRSREDEQIAPSVSLPACSVLPSSSPPALLSAAGVPPQGPGQLPTDNYPTAVPQTLAAPAYTSFTSLSPVQMLKFNEQFGVYIQILTHVHAVCKKKSRAECERESSGDAVQEVNAQCDPNVASEKSEYMLKRILENHRVSTSYHTLINAHITKMKSFSEGLLHQKGQTLFTYETSRPTAYDRPVIRLIEPFLRECETADQESLPDSALKPLVPYERQDVRRSLSFRRNQRQYTMSGAREGWFAWTTADDDLLAMTIAKYGRECGDYVKDLLPHRLEEDCLTRVRYLASRRCQDNPVKRQVLHISTPLNPDELRLVEVGLQQFGGNIDDPNVWKRIQRQFLPTREWSHLQKLWLWRETRRKYKATYRAKLSRKKTIKQGTMVGQGTVVGQHTATNVSIS